MHMHLHMEMHSSIQPLVRSFPSYHGSLAIFAQRPSAGPSLRRQFTENYSMRSGTLGLYRMIPLRCNLSLARASTNGTRDGRMCLKSLSKQIMDG